MVERNGASEKSPLAEGLRALAAAGFMSDQSWSAGSPAIPLDLSSALADDDGPGILTVTLLGVPAGATLSAGTDTGGGRWTLRGNDLEGLTLVPPPGVAEDISLTVTVTASEGDEGGGDIIATSAHLDVAVMSGSPASGAELPDVAVTRSVG